ncbi:MAG: YfiR family protein [Blastocatellia bacterium]
MEASADGFGGDEPRIFQARRGPRPVRSRPLPVVTRRALLLTMLSSVIVVSGLGQSPQRDEYQVKAAFLFNFAKFVEWPPDAFSDGGAPLVIGIVGNDPFGDALEQTISEKSVNNRRLEISRLKWGQNLKGCHILFISSSESRRTPQIIESLKGGSVLTIGEMGQFNQQGGIIHFLMEENKVRFEINATAAAQMRLKISSKLLALAKSVIGR